MRRFAAVLLVACCVAAATPASAAGGDAPVRHRKPVDGPVVDRFRRPVERWTAGNRGVDIATLPGAVVRASARGVVSFAGPVAGALHVVVVHPDGLRTSYSFLRSVSVRRGQRVAAGHPVGTSGGVLHAGVRAGDRYLDPLALWHAGPPDVHLVPLGGGLPDEQRERNALVRLVRGVARGTGELASDARAWLEDGAVAAGDVVGAGVDALGQLGTVALEQALAALHGAFPVVQPVTDVFDGLRDAHERSSRACTPPGRAPPPPARRDRILVLVAGLGSSAATGGRGGAIADVDTVALGYDPSRVLQFSYHRGESTDGHGYSSFDTQAGLRESGEELRSMLQRIRREHPGVPVDVVAHSQGGLVARAALVYDNGEDADLPPIGNLVTLATPHHGADLATVITEAREGPVGALAAAALGLVDPMGIDVRSAAIRDLAEGSEFLNDLNERELPTGIKLTSIAARGDPIVTVPKTDMGTQVVVPVVDRLTAHDSLPGSRDAHRELALALAGMPPTCQTFASAAVDEAVGRTFTFGIDWVGGRLARVSGAGVRPSLPARTARDRTSRSAR